MFDLDGTLVDSDRSLLEPFLQLGFDASELRLGPLLVDECARLGIAGVITGKALYEGRYTVAEALEAVRGG